MNRSTSIVVLKKTKLGETDLIITGFSEEGDQIRAVAKGARRPGSKLGAHLELYSIARVLVYQKGNLGIIREASTIASNEACRQDVSHSAGAAVIVELLDRTSCDGETECRLFPLTCEGLRCLGKSPEEGVALIAAATALKTVAQLGYRPSLCECVLCGSSIKDWADHTGAKKERAFSFDQGGVICEDCLSGLVEEEFIYIDPQLIEWVELLIASRFVDLERYADAEHESLGRALLEFSREWIRFHVVRQLKSLDFLLGFR